VKPLLIAACAALALGSATNAAAALYGPTPYLSLADAPFQPGDFTFFYLEDVEDGLIDSLGLSVTGPGLCITDTPGCFDNSGLTDSVGNGGNGRVGHSIWTGGFTEITFDTLTLGSLPTYAGLVWTDGNNPITFSAYDQDNNLIGTVVGGHADGSFAGTLGDDHFYGVTNIGGISRLTISNPPGTEIDHIQYGLNVIEGGVPEPAAWGLMITGLGLTGAALRRRRAAALAA